MKLFNFKSTEMRIAEKTLKKINELGPSISLLSDRELQNKTIEFKNKLKEGYSLESIRAEVFAVSREATDRILKKRPFDVQMLGGILLDLGSVAEMKTGEGKTITSIAPVYLNALTGKNVIVSTVNEYLSERDALEMGQVFNFLGMTVGINKAQMEPEEKRAAYSCDITYSVHSELGFDYLRDNMVSQLSEKVQRGLYFCLVDEVDSILIDEAKTPLIISGGQAESTEIYYVADQFVRTLTPDDYAIDEESKAITLTHDGIEKANKFFNINNLYDIENSELVHRMQNALRAHKVMKNNVEYIVRDGKIELVDAFTGRIMEGRAYSEGLQQALQAKEMVEIEPETKTLATITYQNFFRMFNKLCGMTGTAKTEESEFINIYNMRVNVVPTNRPLIRQDLPDSIYGNARAKWVAVVEKIKELYEKKQPVLVGTAQIEESELLHNLLFQANIPHTVLNAKQNAQEADIVSQAGQVGAVTIATNMAGRGTDIKPSPEAIELGGLYVLGTDKAESRRIDNQLRGRSGRQGDPGVSKFFLSIDDQLMQRFSNFQMIQEAYGTEGDEEITSKSLQSFYNQAQKKIEGLNYDSRKSVLDYDDVIRQQRDLFYAQRDLILSNEDIEFVIVKMIINACFSLVSNHRFREKTGLFKYAEFVEFLNKKVLGRAIDYKFSFEELKVIKEDELPEYITEKLVDLYRDWRQRIKTSFNENYCFDIEKNAVLDVVDQFWQNHIDAMDKLRSNVNLVQYSQKNPFQVYTEEGTKKFEKMLKDIAFEVIVKLFDNDVLETASIPFEIRQDPMFENLQQILVLDENLSRQEQLDILIQTYKSLKDSSEQPTIEPATEEAKNNV
ncbi:preprotein translocase subunit SecA [Mycoplasmopsis hyopharyngis]|uniref:preprotein translocase subunit SecA n=1 Tax=Mycoplasmopsis hyopharyngis TaxID=29558 RepID=UPI0038737AC5